MAACSLGGTGHLQPLLPFLAAARRRNDEILIVGAPGLKEMVELAGYPFHPGGEPLEVDVAPIRERLSIAAPAEASVLGNRDLFGRMATAAMLPHMEQIVSEWSPDIVLRDPCEYASAIVASRHGIPAAQVAISLAEVEAGSITVAAPALENHHEGLVDELRASPYLTRFPASIDPSPFAKTVRYREDRVTFDRPLPNWWEGSDAPLVYVTFGTVLGYMSIAAGVFRTVLNAVEHLPARVLLSVGRRFDRASLGPLPRNVHVEAWVDQERVFADAAVVVCHGGSGTVWGALSAGVPVVVVPVFADQFENGRRILATGAGVVVETHRASSEGGRAVINDVDAPRIREAIEHVRETPSYRQRARNVAAEMATVPAVDDVLASLLVGLRRGE